MAITVVIADVQARLSSDAYTRLFDPNGSGSVDNTWVQTHLDDAISEATAWLQEHFGDTLPSSLVSSRLVKRLVVALTCANACEFFPGGAAGADEKKPGPYQQHRLRAENLLKLIAKDAGLRVTTSAERPKPQATVTNTTDANGLTTSPYRAVADKEESSCY